MLLINKKRNDGKSSLQASSSIERSNQTGERGVPYEVGAILLKEEPDREKQVFFTQLFSNQRPLIVQAGVRLYILDNYNKQLYRVTINDSFVFKTLYCPKYYTYKYAL
jgi:hypothetical protein